MPAIDLDSFNATPLKKDPYDFLIVPGFIATDAIEAIDRDYPRITKGGSFPLENLEYGAAFKTLIAELEGPEIRYAFEQKFNLNLNL